MEHLADRRAVGRDAVIAGEGEVRPTARRGPVHRRQHRLRGASNQQGEVFPGGHQRRAVLGEHVQVRPGAERPARTREDDDAHLLARDDHAHGFKDFVAHRAVERVELVGPVQGDGGDPARDLHGDALVGGHQTRSTIIAMPWPTPIHIVAKP